MSSDVISKSKVVVQDDFFNEIVDGLKSPVEEKIEKQDAKNSRVQLGGKQLTLLKDKIAPLIGKEVEKNEMVHEYMQHMSDTYEQKKIQQMHNDFVEAVKGYAEIENEADEELEEIENDKKGHSNFLFAGFKILKTIRNVMSFYELIKDMKSQIKRNEDRKKFNIDDYDLNSEAQRRKAGEDAVAYLNEEGMRFVPAMRPILFTMTTAIFDVSQKSFKKINNAIYWEIAKMILQIALEFGAAAAITFFTAGAGAGVWSKVGASIASMMGRIGKFLSVGLKFGSAARSLYRMGRFGRGIVKGGAAAAQLIRRSGSALGNAATRTGRYMLEHRSQTWRAYKYARRGLEIIDIINVDEEDLQEVQEWARSKGAPLRERAEQQWAVVQRDFQTVKSVNEVYRNITSRVTQRISDRIHNVDERNQQKYNSQVQIKNLNFDFETVEVLNTFFKSFYIDDLNINFNSFITQTGNTYNFCGTNMIYDASAMTLEWMVENASLDTFALRDWAYRYNDINPHRKLNITSFDRRYTLSFSNGFIVTETFSFKYEGESNETTGAINGPYGLSASDRAKNYIRLNENKGNKGIEMSYGQFGKVSDMKMFFQYNGSHGWPEYKLKHDRAWSDDFSHVACYSKYGELVIVSDADLLNRIKSNVYVNIFKNDERLENTDPIYQQFKIQYKNGYIDIQGLSQEQTKFKIKKKQHNGENVTFESFDLGEIVLYHESLISLEREFNKKIGNFLDSVVTTMTTENLSELRAAAVKAIAERNTRMQNDESNRRVDYDYRWWGYYSKTYGIRYNYRNQEELERIVSGMTRDELMRITKIDNISDTTQVLQRHGIEVETYKVAEGSHVYGFHQQTTY